MALAALNLAASNLAASLSTIIPTKLASIPVVAGLVVGTAAVGASMVTVVPPQTQQAATVMTVSAPATATSVAVPAVIAPAAAAPAVTTAAPAAPAPSTPRSCETQTWPYLDAKCVAGTSQDRKVRVVSTHRGNDVPTEAQASSDAARMDNPGLISGDTVLRQPQKIAAIPDAAMAREKRKETRRKRERRYVTQSYQVPYEARSYSGPVIVVRPMRTDSYR